MTCLSFNKSFLIFVLKKASSIEAIVEMYSKWLAYFDSWCLSLASFKPPPFSIADSPSTKGLISGAWIFKAVAPFIGYEKPIIKNTFRSVKK